MTAAHFNHFWASTYPGTIPVSHYFKLDYPDRWLRIHSLPQSKRYADDKHEWEILLSRHNTIITDLVGNNSVVYMVAGDFFCPGYTEAHPVSEVESLHDLFFYPLGDIKMDETIKAIDYEKGTVFHPIITEQIWQPHKFDKILIDIAEDALEAFIISIEHSCLIAPYDGGIDIILKDSQTRDFYKTKYKDWLSMRQDGW